VEVLYPCSLTLTGTALDKNYKVLVLLFDSKLGTGYNLDNLLILN